MPREHPFLDFVGRSWAAVERAFWWVWRRIRRQQSALEAEVRALGQEAVALGQGALALGVDLWAGVDDLPFVPSILKITPVRHQLYGHGAFMGAAPALLADRNWRRILAFLMPDVFAQVERALADGAGSERLIAMFENNPVMCAFGVWRAFQRGGRGDLAGLEWDVFLDGEQVVQALEAPEGDRDTLVAVLVDTMVIAHANATDTLQEALGICQYRDVRKTDKAHLGGVEAPAWLDLFGRALDLARAPDLRAAIGQMAGAPRVSEGEACTLYTFAQPRPAQEAVRAFREVTGRPHLSIVFEIKSLRSTPDLLRWIVHELNRRGVHVGAVCSFLLEEVRGVAQMEQVIGGEILPGPEDILLFHFAGDLQHACDQGLVPRGQRALFNGASLIEAGEEEGAIYRVKQRVVEELERYRERHDLRIGLYVQEVDCDQPAAHLLSDLVDRFAHTFALGFAWGGVRDEVALARVDRPRLGYGSQQALERVGKARQWRLEGEE
jgi:hypothetical protein